MNEGSSNKGLIWAVVAILVVAVGAFLFFANNDEAEEEEETVVTEQVVEEEALPAQDIVDVVLSDPSFTTLAAAVQAADLVATLQGEGPFTVFAPTDDAFAAALESLGITAEELLASESLAGILTYHVVAGEFRAADVISLDGQEVPTVNGQSVTISVRDGVVFVNEAQVTATDIEASNGVIHVIDAVLLPTEE